MNTKQKYSVSDYGFEWADYWQGHGSTGFDSSVVGCGFTQKEAFADMLDQAAMQGMSKELIALVESEYSALSDDEYLFDNIGNESDENDEDLETPYYYMAIDWND